ncbi:MAG TPA: DNA repair exonuclease [Candidatus Limnocylindrales bacterium]|nr:DNA repair exonuclease [Candidatus Limnocylindrales bacterium]
MPRLLHIADAHLGARHQDLGEAAARQRERQFAAFRRAIDLAIEERVDLFLVAGDLFDSNSQPRRSVERVASELKRLPANGIAAVLLPGTHDVYDAASIYRTYDLRRLAGLPETSPDLVVLTPERSDIEFPGHRIVVHGRVFATKRAPRSPLAALRLDPSGPERWHVGLIHGSLVVPGRIEQDEVMLTEAEIESSGLDYLALGHWHSHRSGRAGRTVWAYPGALEPMAIDQEGAGNALLVTLEMRDGHREVSLEPRRVGETRFRKLDLDAGEVASQARLVEMVRSQADPDLVLEVRLTGIEPDTLELNDDEIERQLKGSFLRYRIRNQAVPAPVEGPRPPVDTVAGAFLVEMETRIAAAEAAGAGDVVAELRESLRLGRLLLEDPERIQLA